MFEDYGDIESRDEIENWYHYPFHINSEECWCDPRLEYEDPDTGNRVWVHNEIQ